MFRLLAALLLASGCMGGAAAAPASSFDERATAIRKQISVDPQRALAGAEQLRADPAIGASQRQSATADWLRAEALLSLNRPADSLVIVRRALQELDGLNDEWGIRGELILARAGAATALGRVQDALQDNQLAYRLFNRAKDPRGQAKALHFIGSLYLDGGDYETALRYSAQSIDTHSSDPALVLSAQNNRAVAFSQLGRFAEAISAYKLALKYVGKDPVTESLILSNLARVQTEAKDFTGARISLARAFSLSRMNASDPGNPIQYGVAAFLALRTQDLASARTDIERALAGAANADSETLRDLHRTAYEVYRARGDKASALKHVELFRSLDDRQRALAASASAALLNARFNFANQEVKIARLDREQAEAAERFRNVLTKGLLSVAAVISTLLLIGFLSIRRSRNQVRAANASLRTTNVALEKALAAKTEFLATTSHEIRTPLNGILGMTQVILAGRSIDPSLRSRIELVQGAGETMKALVDDILDVAKMETGELRIQKDEMDLRRLLGDAVQVWTGQAETKRIGIEFDFDDAPVKIIADEVRLRQVVFNLMSNAIKFTDRGQVRLASFVEADDDDGERLVIRIADSGIGIPADRLEDIFESFQQVDGGVTRRHGGTGLGLTICRSLARAMGGEIAVSSMLGVGSTFTLTLPLERGVTDAARSDRAAPTVLREARLLMIEPNPLGQGIMRALLDGECAELQFASDVASALDMLTGGGADHVIAEGSALALGPVAAGELAVACTTAGARFTLLWREPDAALRAAFTENGVSHIIAKPISAPDLLSELDRVYGEQIASRDIAA